jgi:hypothetical protein
VGADYIIFNLIHMCFRLNYTILILKYPTA